MIMLVSWNAPSPVALRAARTGSRTGTGRRRRPTRSCRSSAPPPSAARRRDPPPRPPAPGPCLDVSDVGSAGSGWQHRRGGCASCRRSSRDVMTRPRIDASWRWPQRSTAALVSAVEALVLGDSVTGARPSIGALDAVAQGYRVTASTAPSGSRRRRSLNVRRHGAGVAGDGVASASGNGVRAGPVGEDTVDAEGAVGCGRSAPAGEVGDAVVD